jgi:hypothetical protein
MKYNLKYPSNFVSKFKTSTSSTDQIVPNDEHILKKKIAEQNSSLDGRQVGCKVSGSI